MFDKITALYRSRNKQTGQGMVEFGLVIPILLLVILGIFAFGHWFFSYMMVVAASREAARFGIATGLSDTNLPRFRDCDAIRAAALRPGTVVGVKPENVTVWYDSGPTDTCVAPDDNGIVDPGECRVCPVGGIGPGNIDIGDRLAIRVLVGYEPIVPIGWIPKMTLEAIMRRTLIRSIPIDDQETAPGELCGTGKYKIRTLTRIIPPAWAAGGKSTSTAGDPVVFYVEVIDDVIDLNFAPGTLTLYVDEDSYDPVDSICKKDVDGTTTNIIECDPIAGWNDPAVTHIIRAMYEPSDICYLPSKAEPLIHELNLPPLP